MIFLVV